MDSKNQIQNREIKFRAWDDGQMIYSHNNSVNSDSQQLSWFFNRIHKDAVTMQSTGLLDKNDKEIYEGDIVKSNHQNNFVIERINGGLQMYNIKHYGQQHNELIAEATCNAQTKSWLSNAEVIGNIYENPELIKQL